MYGQHVCALDMGEVSRVLADGRETPWYCFLDLGIPVICKYRKTSSKWCGSGMCKSCLIHLILRKNEIGGHTVVLIDKHPEKKAWALFISRNAPSTNRPLIWIPAFCNVLQPFES